MPLDGKTKVSNSRSIHNPQAIAFALHHIDAAPGYVRPSNVASGVVDETRVRNTFVTGHIVG